MKKALKITVSIIGLLLTMALAVGCGKTAQVKSGTDTQAKSGATAQSEQGNPGGRTGMSRQRSPEEIKTLLAPLVKDGTITQQQADKIAEVIFKPQGMNQTDSRT